MAQSATSLGTKTSLFVCFVFFWFLVFAFARKTQFFPQKRAFFVYFVCVSLCFSLAFFELPPFSLSLSLSLSCSCLASFLAVFHFCIWFLLFLFVFCFFVSRCSFVFFFCFSASCLVLFRIIMLDFVLLCILFSGCWCCCLFFLLCYFVVFYFLETCQKHLWKNGNWKTAKMKNAEKQKTDILTRAVSTIVFTNSVFFSFLCFFKFCMFCWKHYKNRGFSKNNKK